MTVVWEIEGTGRSAAAVVMVGWWGCGSCGSTCDSSEFASTLARGPARHAASLGSQALLMHIEWKGAVVHTPALNLAKQFHYWYVHADIPLRMGYGRRNCVSESVGLRCGYGP